MFLRSFAVRSLIVFLCLSVSAGNALAAVDSTLASSLLLMLPPMLLHRGKHWRTPQRISDNAGDADLPQIAVDAAGNAIAVWTQHDGTRRHIWANRSIPGSGWGTAQRIETDDAGDAGFPQVGLNAAGNAIAVWETAYDVHGSSKHVYANRYGSSSGWGTAQLVDMGNDGDAYKPCVAVDAAGNAVAVWQQSPGVGANSLWANSYGAGNGWSTPQLIGNFADWCYAYSPDVAIDAAGTAIAVWVNGRCSPPFFSSLGSNRYVAGSGWETAQFMEDGSDGNMMESPSVAFVSAGQAIAVWAQHDGTISHVWSNRYVAGSGWTVHQSITADSADAWSPQIAADGAGNAFAVWRQQSDGTLWNIFAARYAADSSWTAPQLISTDNSGSATSSQIAVDGVGNAFAVWTQFDGIRTSIFAARYAAGSGWTSSQLISNGNAGSAYSPQIAVDAAGNAMAVWQQYDSSGKGNIWAARYE